MYNRGVDRENPCLTCGACCAFFRVSFYWGETTDSPEGTVPAHLTEDITPFYRAMKGSNQKNPCCAALEGEIGQSVHCIIYELRSSACREFGMDFIEEKVIATPNDYERCSHARAHYNLPPITVDVFRTGESLPIQEPALKPLPAPWPVTRRKPKKNRHNPQRPPDQNPIFPPIA